MPFSQLGLSKAVLRAIADHQHSTPTPIQQQAVPVVLAGKDVLAAAQTGTGKTAAFGWPLLTKLDAQTRTGPAPRVLILTPTRELAQQVCTHLRAYGKYTQLRIEAVYGGAAMGNQIRALKRGIDILVATPGRLIDHLERRGVNLGQIEVLVLDEADRMLDMGFMPAIKRINEQLPKTRQSLLFSATFSPEVRKFANGILNQPQTIDVAPRNTAAETVNQRAYAVNRDRKRELMLHLITTGDWKRVLVFARTKHGADRLADQLERDGLDTATIHGNKSQGARNRALAAFKSGQVRVLVATDVAARGIDVDSLSHVINYELPNTPDDYIHRIGRTGRAGASGEAISLIGNDERSMWREIERTLKRAMPPEQVEGFAPLAGAARSHGSNDGEDFRVRRGAPRQGVRSGARPAYRGGQRRGQENGRSADGRDSRAGNHYNTGFGLRNREGGVTATGEATSFFARQPDARRSARTFDPNAERSAPRRRFAGDSARSGGARSSYQDRPASGSARSTPRSQANNLDDNAGNRAPQRDRPEGYVPFTVGNGAAAGDNRTVRGTAEHAPRRRHGAGGTPAGGGKQHAHRGGQPSRSGGYRGNRQDRA